MAYSKRNGKHPNYSYGPPVCDSCAHGGAVPFETLPDGIECQCRPWTWGPIGFDGRTGDELCSVCDRTLTECGDRTLDQCRETWNKTGEFRR